MSRPDSGDAPIIPRRSGVHSGVDKGKSGGVYMIGTMKNLFTLLLVLIGAAVAVFVGLIWLQESVPVGPAVGPAPRTEVQTGSAKVGSVLPGEIEGFQLEDIERTDPVFEGELFSVHATFAPAEGSPYEGVVESLGLSVFQLQSADVADEILPLLLLGEPEEMTLGGVGMQVFVLEDAGLVGLIWQQEARLFYVLVSGVPDGAESDVEILKEAAIAAANAILGGE
jgi:hypothetical protein